MEYWERIKAAIKHAGGNQTEIADKIRGMPNGEKFKQPTLSLIITRKSKASRYTPLIAEATGVDLTWLTVGQGNMLNEKIMHQAYDIAFLLQQVCEEKGAYLSKQTKYDIVESVLKDSRECGIEPNKNLIKRRFELVANNKKI